MSIEMELGLILKSLIYVKDDLYLNLASFFLFLILVSVGRKWKVLCFEIGCPMDVSLLIFKGWDVAVWLIYL